VIAIGLELDATALHRHKEFMIDVWEQRKSNEAGCSKRVVAGNLAVFTMSRQDMGYFAQAFAEKDGDANT
jgi:hypothetical protein